MPISVMPACQASFFTIPNKSEGFPTSGNDIQVALLMTVLVCLLLFVPLTAVFLDPPAGLRLITPAIGKYFLDLWQAIGSKLVCLHNFRIKVFAVLIFL